MSHQADGTTQALDRRPVKARDSRWAVALARRFTAWGVRPNAISVASVALAALAGASLAATAQVFSWTGHVWLCLAAVAGIQLRLLCNLIDGMVAVEGGLGTKTGPLFNEFPDRLSDIFVLVGAGYAAGPYGPALGWAAALLAVLTAYVRALGGAAGATQPFCGPMAKQHRMEVVCVGSVLALAEWALTGTCWAMPAALLVVVLGSAATVVRRLRLIAAEMRAK